MADRSVVIKLPRPEYERLEQLAELQDRIAEQQATHVIRRWLRQSQILPPSSVAPDEGSGDAARPS